MYGFKKNIKVVKQNLFKIFILSFLSIVMYTSFIYWGLHSTTAVDASLINATVPLFIIILASLFLKEKMTIRKITGIIFSIFGVIFVITKGNVYEIVFLKFSIGNLIIFIAAVSWALFSILTKKFNLSLSPI